MGEAQNWMLMWKRHEFLKPHFQASINSLSDSSEEKAFAEDSSGFFGGFSWPPRSYTCSFCGKEFSSAQALGGHMNVHRRDRAKLKQSLSQKNNQVVLDHQIQNQDPDDEPKFPLESAGFDHNDYSTSLGSRLSGLSTQENFTTSSIFEEELKGRLFVSDSTSKRALNSNIISSERNPEAEKSIKLAGEDSMCLGFDDDDHDRVEINSKRPKIAATTLPFLVSEKKYNSPDLQWRQEILGLKKPATADSMEDLDLELKLGILQ